MSHQGFNVVLMVAGLGKFVNFRKFNLNIPTLWGIKNGVRQYQDGDATGSFEVRGNVLFTMAKQALDGGSWQKSEPWPALEGRVPSDMAGGQTLTLKMENVVVHPPKSFSWNKLEGSEDWYTVEFGIMGQVYLNNIPVFAHRDEAGI